MVQCHSLKGWLFHVQKWLCDSSIFFIEGKETVLNNRGLDSELCHKAMIFVYSLNHLSEPFIILLSLLSLLCGLWTFIHLYVVCGWRQQSDNNGND